MTSVGRQGKDGLDGLIKGCSEEVNDDHIIPYTKF